jgi:hypothetical protein
MTLVSAFDVRISCTQEEGLTVDHDDYLGPGI